MRNGVEIENIEEMRRQQGIEDVELRTAIRGLRAGQFVKLTLLAGDGAATRETLPVRITSIRGTTFRGKLARGPASGNLSSLKAGSLVAFTAAHIHSILNEQRPRLRPDSPPDPKGTR
ncbi:MAG: hypothetical protein L0Z62_20195 [Gemmataceae bacterium]|nr:hypothetical protein [Gemmataceae bacterium]